MLEHTFVRVRDLVSLKPSSSSQNTVQQQINNISNEAQQTLERKSSMVSSRISQLQNNLSNQAEQVSENINSTVNLLVESGININSN